MLGVGVPGHPKAQRGNPGAEAATSPGMPATELGQHSGDSSSPFPLSARRQVRLGRLAPRQALHCDRTGCWRGSRGKKGGPAGNPLTEGASLASSAPAPARLTFRSFSGRYLHSRAISTYLSKSKGAILEIRSPDGSGGGSSGGSGSSWSSGGSG